MNNQLRPYRGTPADYIDVGNSTPGVRYTAISREDWWVAVVNLHIGWRLLIPWERRRIRESVALEFERMRAAHLNLVVRLRW